MQQGGELTDFIEKHGPALGNFELALLLDNGSGEGALLVAEELAFEQRLGQRGAIDRHARLVGACAVAMNGARHQLFARSALAEDQDGNLPRRHARDELVYVAHARAIAHHVVLQADLGLQPSVFLFERLHAAGVV